MAGSEVAVGSNKEHAAIHQFGGTIRPKTGRFLKFMTASGEVFARSVNIPARPFLGMSREDEDMILDVTETTLDRWTRGNRSP